MTHKLTGLAVLGSLLGSGLAAQAQGSYVDDAVLYSRLGPAGTARTLGLAGANVSLGGDLGSLSSNPAGLGVYTKSEVLLSLGLGFGNSSATQQVNAAYKGTGTPTSSTNTANSFHLPSIGVVFTSRRADNEDNPWRGGSFALGITRLADFNQSFRYRSITDDDHSFLQYVREPGGYGDYTSAGYQNAVLRTGGPLDQYNRNEYTNLDGLAYAGYLTDTARVRNPLNPRGPQIVRVYTPARTNPVQQDETVTTRGSLSQFDLGYGGNYRDRLYIGGAIGIVSMRRERTSSFMESSGVGAGFGEDFRYDDYIKTTGTGINARLGLIFRVVDAVRLGASVQTPTYISLQDSYSTTLVSQLVPANIAVNTFTTAPGTYDYSITTPFRANGGVTVLFGKYGFFTGDVEYVGYRSARFGTFDGNSDDFSSTNSTISNSLNNTVNLRLGVEGRFDMFRARVGYAYYGSPYLGATSAGPRAQSYYTGGLGLRTGQFFLDAAGTYLTYNEYYTPYTLDATATLTAARGISPTVAIDQRRFTFSLTGGLLF